MYSLFIAVAALAAFASFGGATLDEKFPDGGLVIGATGRSWDAKELVGDNRGSLFFDVVFSPVVDASKSQRTLLHLRTAGRLTLAWNA